MTVSEGMSRRWDDLPYTSRHVCQIKDEQAMVIRLVTCDPDTLASCSCCDVVAVYANVNLATSYADQTRILCSPSVDVGNVAVCRIWPLGKGQLLNEFSRSK